jgi:hypothetical protein
MRRAGIGIEMTDLKGQADADRVRRMRPSTQVGHGESSEITGNTVISSSAGHAQVTGGILDANLRAIVDAWPILPLNVKAIILSIIRAAKG